MFVFHTKHVTVVKHYVMNQIQLITAEKVNNIHVVDIVYMLSLWQQL